MTQRKDLGYSGLADLDFYMWYFTVQYIYKLQDNLSIMVVKNTTCEGQDQEIFWRDACLLSGAEGSGNKNIHMIFFHPFDPAPS